jgi:hypothetical protein
VLDHCRTLSERDEQIAFVIYGESPWVRQDEILESLYLLDNVLRLSVIDKDERTETQLQDFSRKPIS